MNNKVKCWLWLVQCSNTRAVLAWHLSKNRTYKDALIVLRRAKENAGFRPRYIITDGLWEYRRAVRKVFGYKYTTHIIDTAFGANSIIERLNKEIKRRIKWFSTFQSTENIKAFINLWIYHYNHEHVNRTIGMTPAMKAGNKNNKTLQQTLIGYPSLSPQT